MPQPLVVEYLRTHSFADLLAEHGVRAGFSRKYPHKASLNYDQIDAREDDPLACQCRALVISTVDGRPLPTEGPVGDVVVLARSMDRFFNHGQGHAAKVDPAALGVRVFEKLDGTLIVVYWDPHAGEWCAGTRSVPDADIPIDGFGDHTFRTLFEAALAEHLGLTWVEATRGLVCGWTYTLELTGPRNRIVVDERWSRVHLLSVRDGTGAELCFDLNSEGGHWVFPTVESHAVDDMAGLLAFVNARPPTEAEGVVLRGPGPDFHRVKVKSEAYRLAHAMRDAACASPRALLHLILLGQDDDVFPLLPEHQRAKGEAAREDLRAWLVATDAQYARLRAEAGSDRKAMALAAQREGAWIAPMMSMWQGQAATARGWVDRAKGKDGRWADSFLDQLGERIQRA
jgi:hypothetical protein